MVCKFLPLISALLFCTTMLGAQSGTAACYRSNLYGQPTSTGEILDQQRFTAASQHYDWGTVLEVTNTENNRTARVWVNDCGPHNPEILLDLSKAAADQLAMGYSGFAPVIIRVVRPSSAGPTCHRGEWARKLRAAGKPVPPPPTPWKEAATAHQIAIDSPQQISGLVGAYPENADGNMTSTEEVYRHDAATAASTFYPYNSILELTSVTNGNSTQVRVNDCGPIQPDRILNVSRAAAAALGIGEYGPAKIDVRVIKLGQDGPTCQDEKGERQDRRAAKEGTALAAGREAEIHDSVAVLFGVQVGSFRSGAGAGKMLGDIRAKGFQPAFILENGAYYRVYAGKFPFRAEAEEMKLRLRQAGFPEALVRRVQ